MVVVKATRGPEAEMTRDGAASRGGKSPHHTRTSRFNTITSKPISWTRNKNTTVLLKMMLPPSQMTNDPAHSCRSCPKKQTSK